MGDLACRTLERLQLWISSLSFLPAILRVYLVAAVEIMFIMWWHLFGTTDTQAEVEEMIDGNKHSPRSKRRNRVAVVTGGDSGVGLQVARGLLRAGYRVYVGVFHESHGRRAVESLLDEGFSPKSISALPLDLSDFSSIESFVDQFHAAEASGVVDLLVNNAGVMDIPFQTDNKDLEMQVSVNFVGHVKLTQLLLPYLKKAKSKATVVNVGSSAHYGASDLDFNSFRSGHNFSGLGNYAKSKACVTMYSIHNLAPLLAKSGIRVVVVHPGLIPTGLYARNPFGIGKVFACLNATPVFRSILHLVMLSEAEGAWAVLCACLRKQPNGCYLAYGKVWRPSQLAQNKEMARQLADWTRKQMG